MRRLLIALAVVAAGPAAAHEFWIEPARFRATSGESVPLRFLIGDHGATEPWTVRWRLAVSLRSVGPGGLADHQATIRPTEGSEAGGAAVTLTGEGTHVVAFESSLSESDLPADRFNAYIEHEGLTPIVEARRRAGQQGTNGREIYSRRAKALVQVGAVPSDHPLQPIGQTLEIVPERNPFAPGAELPLRILYRGRPLAGARVTLTRLDDPARHSHRISDAAGRVTFPLAAGGRWRVATIWSAPTVHARAEWDTVFASLTFGR